MIIIMTLMGLICCILLSALFSDPGDGNLDLSIVEHVPILVASDENAPILRVFSYDR